MVEVDELLLTDLELRHEVVVTVLSGGAARAHARLHERLQLRVEREELVLPERVELREGPDAARDRGVEAEPGRGSWSAG